MSKKEKKGCCLFAIIKWFLILCGVLFVIAFVSVVTDKDDLADAAPVATIAPAAEPAASPTPVPTATPSPANRLNNAVVSVFGENLNKCEIRYNDLFIETHIDIVLTSEIEKKSYQLKVLDVLKKIAPLMGENELNINTVYLSAYCDFKDLYGNTTSKEAFYSAFRKDTIQKINFDGISFKNIPSIADDWYEHPEFKN